MGVVGEKGVSGAVAYDVAALLEAQESKWRGVWHAEPVEQPGISPHRVAAFVVPALLDAGTLERARTSFPRRHTSPDGVSPRILCRAQDSSVEVAAAFFWAAEVAG